MSCIGSASTQTKTTTNEQKTTLATTTTPTPTITNSNQPVGMPTSQDVICYHHFSLTFNPVEASTQFRDIAFVLVAGCAQRVEALANYLSQYLFNGSDLQNHQATLLTKPSSRFTLFRVGPVLISNHGMGSASMSIALHELLLMCQRAGVLDRITLIRFGTCKLLYT